MRTHVFFHSSAFDTTTPKFSDHGSQLYVGEDVCNWLIIELKKRGISASAPDHSTFGWTFDFTVANAAHSFTIGFFSDDSDYGGVWEGWLQRTPVFFGEPKSRNRSKLSPKAVRLVQSILSESPDVFDTRWEEHA